MPSDSIMAQAMAQVAVNTGVDSVTVVYLDDGYGRPLARLTMERLNELGIDDVRELPFTATDDDLTDDADELLGDPLGTLIVIADSNQGWRMMAEIAQVVEDDPPFLVVGPAMREAPQETLVAMPAVVRDAIQGVSPTARLDDIAEPAGDYAVNAHDCVNLIALATIRGGSDSPEAIASWMPDVSAVGEQCLTFQRCIQILEDDRNINYQGLGRFIDLSQRGDPERARVEVFGFNESGLDYFEGIMSITDPDVE
jgi:branched-chain amino acid transport system substrate-binding protein